MEELDGRLCGIWKELLAEYGYEQARSAHVSFDVTFRELDCLKLCLTGVLDECDGNPVELEVRVGEVDDVRRLLQQLELVAE